MLERAAAFLREPCGPELVVNIGRIGGGTPINSIAAEAMLELDRLLELDRRSENPDVLAAAGRLARGVFAAAPDGLEAGIELLGHRPSGRLAADHPRLRAARRARAEAGLAPARESASSTDANAAYGSGIPAITVGVTTAATRIARTRTSISHRSAAGCWPSSYSRARSSPTERLERIAYSACLPQWRRAPDVLREASDDL